MTKRIAIEETVDDELKAISAERKKKGSLVKTKIGIISELIRKAYNRECKK